MPAPKIITLTANDGSTVEFVNEVKGSGAMKDVYFSPDKSYVVGFFRDKQDAIARARLEDITGKYRDKVFNQVGGKYWEDFFCWPTKIVEWEGKTGIVCPTYQSKYFFKGGRFDGQEKQGKWFASAKLMNKFIEPDQKGTFLTHMNMCLKIARAVRRMHAAGLAHSDLSYKNVLVDPLSSSASIIDIDGLVVPGKYPPDVMGTPDFVAPEVLETRAEPLIDPATKQINPKKKLPSRLTDEHALAVLIYMYLLNRHPLRGGRVCDLDPAKDEELSMGKMALFVEHPTDKSNRPKVSQMAPSELPQGDVTKRPYTICGPYLKPLFFDNTTKPRCPFCGAEYHGQLPVLNLYYSHKAGSFHPENHRLMVYDGQSLYMWHVNRNIAPNEKIKDEHKKPVGDFHFHHGRWILINRKLNDMWDVTDPGNHKQIQVGEYVELTEGRQILLDKDVAHGGRLVIVQLVKN